MPISAVLFDIGGVLEHTPPTGWQARWTERTGLTREDFEERLGPIWADGSIGTSSLTGVHERLAAALQVDPGTADALMADVWAEYLGTLNVPLTALLAGLRAGFRTGIVSNSFVGARERENALYGFESACDTVVYSHEEGVMKPDPRIYLTACDRLGVVPSEVLFLDDVAENVEGARRAGMTAIRFTDTAQAVADLRRALHLDLADWCTEQLELRAMSSEDTDRLHQLHSDPRVWRHLPSGVHSDRAQTERLVALSAAAWAEDGLGFWTVSQRGGRFIGVGGCRLVAGSRAWNLYYRLVPEAHGHGYASELARAGRAAAACVHPDVPVIATLLEHNAASRAVAERAGLSLVWRGPDAGNSDPSAVRLVFADRPVSDELVAALAAPPGR